MKGGKFKIIFPVIAFIAIALLTYFITVREMKDYIPNIDSIICSASDNEGNSYTCYDNGIVSGIYKLSSSREILKHIRFKDLEAVKNTRARVIDCDNEFIYLAVTDLLSIKIVIFDKELNTVNIIEPVSGNNLRFGGMSVNNDGYIYLTMLTELNSSAFVYRLSLNESPISVYNEPAPTGLKYLSASFIGNTLEAEYSDGSRTAGFSGNVYDASVLSESGTRFIFSNGLITLIRNTVIALAVFFVLILFTQMIAGHSSYLWRKILLTLIITAACMGAVLYVVAKTIPEARLNDRVEYSQAISDRYAAVLLGYNSGSDASEYNDAFEKLYSLDGSFDHIKKVMVVGRSGDTCSVLVSEYEPVGKEIGPAGSGETYTYSKIGTDSTGSAFVLCVTDTSDINDEIEQTVLKLSYSLGIILLVGIVLLSMTFLQDSIQLSAIASAMEKVSKGKLDHVERNISLARDYDRMWNSLTEFCRSKDRTIYARDKVFRAYYRFAPKNLEKILGKDDISDVRVGDTIRVDGIISSLKFASTETADSEHRLTSLNSVLNTVFRCRTESDGIMLSDGYSLDSLKVLFTEDCNKAINFGVNTCEAVRQEIAGSSRSLFICMHKTQFLYGIAGTEEQSFPCIKSTEIECFDEYRDRLAELGLNFVVTENVLNSCSDEVHSRYLGYLELKKIGSNIRIYEILDACPVRERKLKTDTAESFKKALDMYYRNDFYLARNGFSDVIKDNPYDLVARWYIFRCEYMLNSPDFDNFDYALLA